MTPFYSKKSKAGKKYKVYTDDIKIRRWIESGELKEGDLVIVEYEGEISSNYEVKGAYSIFTGTLEENGIFKPGITKTGKGRLQM